MPHIVSLSVAEIRMAAEIGICRQIAALAKQSTPRNGCPEADAWSRHIEGAAAEIAFAKDRNLYWPATVNTYHARADLGDYEIRHTDRAYGRLIIRADDSETSAFVLVRGAIPRFEIVGWLWGYEGKQPAWNTSFDHRPAAYFVPVAALHPLEQLPMLTENDHVPF